MIINCQLFASSQKVKQLDYGGGLQKSELYIMRLRHSEFNFEATAGASCFIPAH